MHSLLRRIADAVGVPAALGRGVEDYATGQLFRFRAVTPNTSPRLADGMAEILAASMVVNANDRPEIVMTPRGAPPPPSFQTTHVRATMNARIAAIDHIEDRAHDYMDAADHDRDAASAACDDDLVAAIGAVAELEEIARMIEGMEDRGYHGPDRRGE